MSQEGNFPGGTASLGGRLFAYPALVGGALIVVAKERDAGTERIGPVTPGDVLREGFMVPLGLTARALVRELGVPSISCKFAARRLFPAK